MYNRIILMGRLVADPELRQTQRGISMCRFRIAVDRFAKKDEEKQADFFEITAWRQQAEFVSRYFTKGRMIHIEGRLQNNNYTDQNGVKHYAMQVIADSVCFCGDKGSSGGSTQQQYSQSHNAYSQPAQTAPKPVELGNLDDFEEILGDGEVPF